MKEEYIELIKKILSDPKSLEELNIEDLEEIFEILNRGE